MTEPHLGTTQCPHPTALSSTPMSATRRSHTFIATPNASPSAHKPTQTRTHATGPVPVATARTTPEGSSSSTSLQPASVRPSGQIELTPDPSCPSFVNFFTRGVILRLVQREPVIIVINGFAVMDYLQTNLTVRFCRAPPDSVRKVVPTNSWVVQATSATNAINVAKEIKSAVSLATDNNDREPDIKISRVRLTEVNPQAHGVIPSNDEEALNEHNQHTTDVRGVMYSAACLRLFDEEAVESGHDEDAEETGAMSDSNEYDDSFINNRPVEDLPTYEDSDKETVFEIGLAHRGDASGVAKVMREKIRKLCGLVVAKVIVKELAPSQSFELMTGYVQKDSDRAWYSFDSVGLSPEFIQDAITNCKRQASGCRKDDARIEITKKAFWPILYNKLQKEFYPLYMSPVHLLLYAIRSREYSPHFSWVSPSGPFGIPVENGLSIWTCYARPQEAVREDMYNVFFDTTPASSCLEWELSDQAFADMSVDGARSHASRRRDMLDAMRAAEGDLATNADAIPTTAPTTPATSPASPASPTATDGATNAGPVPPTTSSTPAATSPASRARPAATAGSGVSSKRAQMSAFITAPDTLLLENMGVGQDSSDDDVDDTAM
eukprot:jgi/Undpi1/13568/HiC_scaffold_8.g03227.m1